ncbi:hypothetical protein DTO166G4_989 [Paecilomyces variotii]|nr:hypothetical protein DTO166G4_989 [Paecilomyces variotii]KAJ9230575.1 hypothetical protein DTO166G5_7225 [Paecilomyces variotii]
MAGIDKTSYIFKWLSETEVPSGLHTKRTSDDFNGTRAPIRECNAPEEVQNQNKTSHKLIQQQRSENTHANPLQPPYSDQVDHGLNTFRARNPHDSPNARFYHTPDVYDRGGNRTTSSCQGNLLGIQGNSVQKSRRVISDDEVVLHSPVTEKVQGLTLELGSKTANTKRRRIVEKKYERKSRAKTRPDRYQPKATTIPQRIASTSRQRNNKPRRKRRRHTQISEDFNAANVTTDRLTVQPGHRMGIFGKGRTSTPVKPRDLPDLTFSEMNFLHKRGHRDDHRDKQATEERYLQPSPAERSYRKISQYFSTAVRPVDTQAARQKNCKENGQEIHCHEIATSGIHRPQIMTTSPLSRKSNLVKSNNYSRLLPDRTTNTNTRCSQKMSMDPDSSVICPYPDREAAAHSQELDPSLLTYVTGILLNESNPRNDERYAVAEDKKAYYNLEDLKKLSEHREHLQSLQDDTSGTEKLVVDLGNRQYSMNTRSKHHPGNYRSTHPNHAELLSRGHPQNNLSHERSTEFSVHVSPTNRSASQVMLAEKITGKSPWSVGEGELPFDHCKPPATYYISNSDAKEVGDREIEKGDECFSQHQGPTGSLDLQTEYAISASIPSVDDILFNLYGNSHTVEEILDMKNEEFDKWEFQDELPGFLTLSPGSRAGVAHGSHDKFLSDIPFAQPILGSTLRGAISKEPLYFLPEVSRPYTSQLPTWDSSFPLAADSLHKSPHMQDLATQHSALLEQTHHSSSLKNTTERDCGPPAFWRQNRLY